jgi:ATP-dependent Clp protease ATP-binding subunit ClpC
VCHSLTTLASLSGLPIVEGMLEFPAKLWFLIHRLEEAGDGRPQVWVEPLLFPEITTLGESAAVLRRRQVDLAKEALTEQPLSLFHQRFIAGTPQMEEVTVEVPPHKSGEAWREPVLLKICYIWWRHEVAAGEPKPGNWVAWVPALRIGLACTKEPDLPGKVKTDVLAAIRRDGYNLSLNRLSLLARAKTELHGTPWNAWPDTPAERWLKEHAPTGKGDALKDLTTRMEPESCQPAFEIESTLMRVVRLLAAEDHPSVLLVGPAGVGKTALVQELVRRRTQLGLGKQSIHRTSGASLVAGACGFGMWQQRCQDLIQAARTGGVILYAGNLFELANTGQSASSTESLASFFRPAIVRGEIQFIMECTPEQLVVLEKQDPRLTESLRIVRMTEPDAAASQRILQAVSQRMRGRFAPEALQQVDLLHRRYAALSAFPGKPLRFMAQLDEGLAADQKVDRAQVFAAFSEMSGMPRDLLDPARPLDLEAVRTWFSSRVRGQTEAVQAVVGMLARTKASMSRPGRPLASFLFAGPTGTGKTETAKALAHWLFRSPDRLVRIDASEYSKPWSAGRLVSGARDGKEGVLTAAVREQPFSVVLIDEFEKAHPAVFDLLLQVLGEARLTDAAGRVADFSNCVIIMTSNLGAENFGRSALGFGQEPATDGGAAGHFTEAVRRAVRPEFFNRIDRIVAFQPLTREIVRELTRREVALVSARPGLAGSDLSLEVPDALVDSLAAEGWDARYGARPLKRKVAERLLAPLADLLCEGVAPRSVLTAVAGKTIVRIQVRPPAGGSAEAARQRSLLDHLAEAGRARRRWNWLTQHSLTKGLASRLRLLDQQITAAKRHRKSVQDLKNLNGEHHRISDLLKQLMDRLQARSDHEEALLLSFYEGSAGPGAATQAASLEDMNVWEKVFLRLLAESRQLAAVAVVLQSASGSALMEAVRVYRAVALEMGGTVDLAFYRRKPISDRILKVKGLPHQVRPEPAEPSAGQLKISEGGGDGYGAVVLWITGPLAVLLVQPEGGVHAASEEHAEVAGKKQEGKPVMRECWRFSVSVRPADDFLKREDLVLSAESLLRPDLAAAEPRRIYDLSRKVVKDGLTNEKKPGLWTAKWLAHELRRAVMHEAGWTESVERGLK